MMMKYSKRVAGIILCAAMAGNLLAGCSANQKTETAADKAESEVSQTQQPSEKRRKSHRPMYLKFVW